MNYPLQPKRERNSRKNYFIAVSVICFILVFEYIFPNVLPRVSFFVAKPFWQGKDFLAAAFSNNELLRSKAALIDQNNLLQQENQVLADKALGYDLLLQENENLKTLLGQQTNLPRLGAPVILHPSESPYDLLVAQIPVDAHIALGDRVVVGNTALGTIEQIVGTNAKVKLYSSPGLQTEGRLIKNGTPLSLSGKGGGNFTIQVPRDLDVAVGDIIELPGDPSFALARVANIDETETDSFKTVLCASPENIFSLGWVEILYAQ